MSICADPTFGAEVNESRNLEIQFTLSGPNIKLLTNGLVLVAFCHFQVYLSHGQFNLERPIYVGEGRIPQLQISTIILKPGIVDLSAMTVRRNVPAIPGTKC